MPWWLGLRRARRWGDAGLLEQLDTVRRGGGRRPPRPRLSAGIKLWRGDARGRWEDKTLVIDSTNFNGLSWFGSAGDFYSDALHLTERLTMVDANTIDYAVTIDDPKVSTRPWTMVFALERNKEKGYEQMEEGCFESDRDTADLLLTGFKTYTGPRFPK